jgi:probable HAF family extracellular repeat protein
MRIQRTVIAASLLACVATAQARVEYVVKTVDVNRPSSYVTGINNRGDLVGYWSYYSGYNYRPFFYNSATGQASLIDHADKVVGVNNVGQAAVMVYDQSNNLIPAIFNSANGQVTHLPVGAPNYNNSLFSLNNAGVVAGQNTYARPDGYWDTRATLWSGGQAFDLGTMGGRNSMALDVNSKGEAVGISDLAQPDTYAAFLYTNGQMVALGTLGGDHTRPYAINDSSVVVGQSRVAGSYNEIHAFIYQNGVMTDMGMGADSWAVDINESGLAIGNAGDSAFVYLNGKGTLLDQLIDPASGWHVSRAADVNERGQIAATVCRGLNSFDCTGAVLTPVPEPTTYGMLLAGLGVIGALLRSRRAVG